MGYAMDGSARTQPVLTELLAEAGFASLSAFCRTAKIGRRTARHLQEGNLAAIRLETLRRIAVAFGVDVADLIERFEPAVPVAAPATTDWQLEYERLRAQFNELEAHLREAWDLAFFRRVELLLLQLPTLRKAADQNPALSAQTVLDLMLPFEEFVHDVGFETLGTPGERVPFDPTLHQGAGLSPGEPAKIKTVGYRYRGQLLARARVNAVG